MTGLVKRKAILRALDGERVDPVPIWLMRQAGRYLPEYRAVRAQAPDFIRFCLNPDLATEVTLQPIRRFGFDAAIVFADILLVPFAMGQGVEFLEGEGPRLSPVNGPSGLDLTLARSVERLHPVFETLRRVKEELPHEASLIGFAGAPWTVATYMVGGGGSADQAAARLLAYRDQAAMQGLIDALVVVTSAYLKGQAEAGADVLQIFDTWAGALPEAEFERWVIAPTKKIIQDLRLSGVTAPVIGFPKGAANMALRYVAETGVDGIGLDGSVPLMLGRTLQSEVCIQGILDPLVLVAGGVAQARATEAMLKALSQGPYIFNLGHGIRPETPVEHVGALVKQIRGRR